MGLCHRREASVKRRDLGLTQGRVGLEPLEVIHKAVPGYPNYTAGSDGHVYSRRTGAPLSPRVDPRTRHLRVRLYGPLAPLRKHYGVKQGRPGPRFIDTFVHQVVCRSWHGERPDWADLVRHLDGVPSNNKPQNLAWGTHSQNAEDREWLKQLNLDHCNALEREGFALEWDPTFCYVPDEAFGF